MTIRIYSHFSEVVPFIPYSIGLAFYFKHLTFLGYKIKSEEILTSLGFSLMISKSAETLRRVNTRESLQTLETKEVSFLVHLQGSE